ncbi:T9SS type A sorting domain-containing protein, partial [Candidatus Desantisbacteria bacterium]|nr:T9SS type A sorting domain-containing protein [Candidatus Desantisbacteria bacterium]
GKEGGSSSLRFDFDIPGNRNTKVIDNEGSLIQFNKEESLVDVATSLSVSPENKIILAGNSQSYSAFAKCEAGSVNVTGSATFSASGGGSWTTNIFEAHYLGTYTITASFLGLIGTTNVYITPGTPTALLYVSGDNQTASCTETLADPFIVKVEDAYHNPCSNVSVNFAVISSPAGAEGYSLSGTDTLTNLDGTTSSYLTLGDEPPGSWTIRASSGSLTPFDFTAWSLRRFGNIAGICLIDRGTESQKQGSITITLVETGATTTTNSNSYFIFSNIPVGTYTLFFTFPGATPATRTNSITQTQFNDTTDIGTVTLIMGDPNGDGQINMLDWPYVADSYGSQQGDQNYNPSCDFNGDGQINLLDLLIFADNYGEQQQGKGMKAKTKTRGRAIALSFEPKLIENAKVGEIITMKILISSAKDSYGGEVHLSFNQKVLEAIVIDKGDWIKEGYELCKRIDNTSGKIDLALGSIKPKQESSGLFATITFRIKAEGESAIKFEFDNEANRETLFIEKGYVVPEITTNEGKIEVIPSVSMLLQSYPNPAKDLCYIPFKLSENAEVTVEVYNILGQKVKEINAGYKKAGLYIAREKALSYNLRNDKGDRLSQGLYFIRLTAGKYSGKGRLVIQR